MRYYLKTNDPTMVASFRELTKVEQDRIEYVRGLARNWGFDEVGMRGFGSHVAFFKLAKDSDQNLRIGPPVDGFRPCRKSPREHYEGKLYFRYYFHGNHKLGTKMRKQLENGMPPLPEELRGSYFRKTVDVAFCIRHGLPPEHFAGNKILFPMVHLLQGDLLVMSLPVTDKDVVIPEGCEEITERAWGAEIDKHNASVEETGHDNQ